MAELALDKLKMDGKNASISGDGENGDSDSESDSISEDGHSTTPRRTASAQPVEEQKPLHPKLNNVNAVLEMKNLWDEFNELGTEMIVTKVSFSTFSDRKGYGFLCSEQRGCSLMLGFNQ